MEYRGIGYDVKIGTAKNQWVWTAHTPKARQGTSTSRALATFNAHKAIDAWCARHPEQCDPRPAAA